MKGMVKGRSLLMYSVFGAAGPSTLARAPVAPVAPVAAMGAMAAMAAIVAFTADPPSLAAQDAELGEIASSLESMREEWRIPGLAVAVVRGDSVLLARGFGVREAGRPEAVGSATLFAIGSATKAFTSAVAASLVDDASLTWDDPVVDHLPGFRLTDPWTTREITLRDLLAHRSGLPMANFMWLPGGADRDELIRRLRHLEPTTGFREAFTYQNVLYAAAGTVLERASGAPWSELVRDRLLAPLGMGRTRTSLEGLDAEADVATPHARVDGVEVPVPYRDIHAVAPAGALLSTASDMARWLRFQLGTEGALEETRRPQIPMRLEGPLGLFYPRARRVAYGMGWTISDYRGRTLLDHGGGIDGMTTLVALVPDEEIGVAILSNRQLPLPPYWILYSLLDELLEAPERVDWSGHFREVVASLPQPTPPEREADADPSHGPSAYVGAYRNPVLGSIEVEEEAGALGFAIGTMGGTLEPWHHDTFRAAWDDVAWSAAAGPGWVTFRLDRGGEVEALVFEPLPGERWRFERLGVGAGPS